MGGCMGGCMDGWMDGWVGGWMGAAGGGGNTDELVVQVKELLQGRGIWRGERGGGRERVAVVDVSYVVVVRGVVVVRDSETGGRREGPRPGDVAGQAAGPCCARPLAAVVAPPAAQEGARGRGRA